MFAALPLPQPQRRLDPRPHDLIFWSGLTEDIKAATAESAGLPSWINVGWPVVLRRAPFVSAGAWLPVGLRGSTRSQRCAAFLSTTAISAIVTPESLIPVAALASDDALPALITLRQITKLMCDLGLVWGPTGGVGFALASGAAVVRGDSDLDLLVRSPAPLNSEQIQLLQQVQSGATLCRIDIQVDTGHGGFAFSEFQRSATSVLLKTSRGPMIVSDPWSYQTEVGAAL